jgi:competence protein ComEC
MPLIASALCCYAAGLLLGFGGVALAGAVPVLLTLLWAVLSRRMLLAGGAVLAVAGQLTAFASGVTDRRCRADALVAGEWLVTLEEPAAPGAYVRGELTASGCRIVAALAVRSGTAAAGTRVMARGLALPSRRGIRIGAAELEPRDGRALLLALRASTAARIDAAFGENAPMARALLVADRRQLEPALRERFATAGIAHLLSISGLHVGIIAMAAQLALGVLRLPRRAAQLASALLTALYVLLIGAPAPAVRAGVMLGVLTASRMMQRPTSPWAALALGAAAPLARPSAILEPGFQLTVSGMAAILSAGVVTRRWIRPRWRGWRAYLASSVSATVLANIVTAPVIAWHFGAVSLVAPLTNLVATPLVTVLQPALFLAMLAGWWPAAARFVADASHPLLVLLQKIAAAGATLPFAALVIAPTMLGACLALVATLALVVACASRRPSRPALAAMAALVLATWAPLIPSRGGELELHMIDVGQGDAFAMRTPAGRWVIFDAGRSWRGGDAGRGAVIPYVRRRGGDVYAFVLSHPHDDHVGGTASVIRALRPKLYVDAAYIGGSESYAASLRTAEEAGTRWVRARPGDSVVVDGVVMRWLAPDSLWLTTLRDPNDGSVVAQVEYGAVRFLLTGDAERAQENWLLRHVGERLRADVLKVGHHGSSTSSSAEFLAAVSPRVALISVGAGNRYGHPSPQVLHALGTIGAEVLRSDAQGSIIVRTDGIHIRLEAEGDRWELPERSPVP